LFARLLVSEVPSSPESADFRDSLNSSDGKGRLSNCGGCYETNGDDEYLARHGRQLLFLSRCAVTPGVYNWLRETFRTSR
jgi:hypothetical protein